MYLASTHHHGRKETFIRQSYFDSEKGIYSFRQVFDLGENPEDYIHRINERSFYFDAALEDAVGERLGKDPTTYLEELLGDYLPLEYRQLTKNFQRSSRIKLTALSVEEQREVEKYIHIFDRRRLFYIRYGAVDQSRIFRLNDKLYRPLLYKCRDEKEYYIRKLELSLLRMEFKKYIYVVFNLQKHFAKSYATFMPEALDSGEMDEVFLTEICELNGDETFWQDQVQRQSLRRHLHNYLVYFFDYDFAYTSFADNFFNSFRAQHRQFRWPASGQIVGHAEIGDIFGIQFEKIKKMGRNELVRLFREKAKEHHPDRGGDQEEFVRLLAAYEELKKQVYED